MPTAKDKVLYSAIPLGWLLGVDFDGTDLMFNNAGTPGTPPTAPAYRLLFDAIKDVKIKYITAGSDAAGGENIDIEHGDYSITRFPKKQRINDGIDGSEITEATSGEDATGKAQIDITVNEGDLDSSTWTEFINKLISLKDKIFYIVVPVGANYQKRFIDAQKNADGYAYMLGKLSSDIESAATNSPSTITLTFVSYKFTSSDAAWDEAKFAEASKAFNVQVTGLPLKDTDITMTPYLPTTAESTKIGQGDLVLRWSAS